MHPDLAAVRAEHVVLGFDQAVARPQIERVTVDAVACWRLPGQVEINPAEAAPHAQAAMCLVGAIEGLCASR
jgi:hypothetical protein